MSKYLYRPVAYKATECTRLISSVVTYPSKAYKFKAEYSQAKIFLAGRTFGRNNKVL